MSDLLAKVASYYSSRLLQHGDTPLGVDWNSKESHELRFEQLSKIINAEHDFSINDLGCGYGALYDFLDRRYGSFSYLGVDVSEDMIRVATQRYSSKVNADFIAAAKPNRIADYSIASGIFNVRFDIPDSDWLTYVEDTLDVLSDTSHLGFAFNSLTSYSDADRMRSTLYYADPCYFFDLCKRKYSKNVALLHDYGLYEFTILVRK